MLIFLAPIGNIEQNKKDKSPQIINIEYDMIGKKNIHLIDSLFKAYEEKSFTRKSIEKKEIYYLKKDIIHLVKNFFISFKK